MKKIILLLTLLLLANYSANADTKFDVLPIKKIEANPINIAVSLTERTDSATIASICEYYGYIIQPSQDGYTIFKHPNGSIIRYSFNNSDNRSKYPTIEVKCKASPKEKDQRLKNLNFQKSGNSYERRALNSTIKCTYGPRGFIVFSQFLKVKQ